MAAMFEEGYISAERWGAPWGMFPCGQGIPQMLLRIHRHLIDEMPTMNFPPLPPHRIWQPVNLRDLFSEDADEDHWLFKDVIAAARAAPGKG